MRRLEERDEVPPWIVEEDGDCTGAEAALGMLTTGDQRRRRWWVGSGALMTVKEMSWEEEVMVLCVLVML